MRGRTLLNLGHGVKGQGQLWKSVYKTLWTQYRLLQFLPNHFQTSHVSCRSWEEEPYWFWQIGSKVKVNFDTLFKILWAGYRLQFLPNNFQPSHISCWWREEEPYWFGVTGSKVNVNFAIFGTLSLCISYNMYKVLWAQYRLQFMSNHFQTPHVGTWWWG